MKLWKKISIICIAILIVVDAISYGGLVWYTEKELVGTEVEYQQKVLMDTREKFIETYYANVLVTDSEIVKNSLANYLFSQIGSSDMVLYKGAEIVYSTYDLDPRRYLGNQSYCNVEINGEQFLILKSKDYDDEIFEIYLMVSIQEIYDNLNDIFGWFLLLNMGVILVGILFIIFAVKMSLRPLHKLEESTKMIALGDYSRRIEVKNQDEIGNLSVHFNKMSSEIEEKMIELTEYIERQKIFVGAVSHEYKTPITAMLLHIDMLQNMYLDETKRAQSLDILESQCEWLEELTQKLLQITSLNQYQRVNKKPYQINKLFQKVKDSTEAILQEKQQALIIKVENKFSTSASVISPLPASEITGLKCENTTMLFDMDLLHSALVNLIVNGSRASEIGQEIYLIEADHKITVKDFGKGMDEKELEKITEPFYRVDTSRNRKTGGLGLGLTLVEEIIKVHGATLEIRSVLQQGTTVMITFP
ncbi:MAG: HAMP domain-containing sensor histidine kinase [Eubacteriales bacterium]